MSIKSLFIKEEANTVVKENTKSKSSSTSSSPVLVSPTISYQTPTTYTNVSGVVVPEIKESLEKALMDNNFPGEDYIELREAIKSMVTGTGLDATTAMKAAFATLASRGLTKSKAVETAGKYIEIINKEKEKFLATVSSRTEQKVSKPKQEIEAIAKDNISLAKEIENITKKMNDNNEAISKKKGEIAEQESIIERTKTNYEFTHSIFVKEIQDDVMKIQLVIA